MFIRRLPIWIQLLMIAVITVLVTVSVFFITYSQISGIIMEKNARYTEQLISQLKQNVSTNYKEISSLLFNLGYDSTVQEFMMETDPLKIHELDKKVTSLMGAVKSAKSDLFDIIIIGKFDNHSSMNGGVEFASDMEKAVPPDGYMHNTGFIQTPYWKDDQYRFLFGVNIFSIDRDRFYGEKIGFAAAIVDANGIVNQINKMPELSGTKIYLLDKNGRVFSSTDTSNKEEKPEFIDSIAQNQFESVVKIIDGEKSVVQVCNLPEIDGKIISVVPEKALFSELSTVQKRNLIIFFIALLLLSVPFAIVIRNILFPLQKMTGFMNKIKSGDLKNLKKRIELEGYAEMTLLAKEFNGMLDEIDALTHRLVETSTRLLKTELDRKESMLAFLQSQINPHFLYNTFECIKGIASARGVPEIRDMTKALSRIFCYSVKGSDEVGLDEEISIVKSYVQINKIRFAERFDVEYNISDAAYLCAVPKMILQPVIENAIFHGLEPLTRKGKLYITGRITDNYELIITIKDNGTGIGSETLEKLKRELEGSRETDIIQSNTRIGLVNVNNRIKLKFGSIYGISITSEPDHGTEITLRMPARRMGDVQSLIG